MNQGHVVQQKQRSSLFYLAKPSHNQCITLYLDFSCINCVVQLVICGLDTLDILVKTDSSAVYAYQSFLHVELLMCQDGSE